LLSSRWTWGTDQVPFAHRTARSVLDFRPHLYYTWPVCRPGGQV
jgi:hypothetical protein